MKKTNQSAVGTSYHDSNIDATVKQLKTVLGEPNHSVNDGKDKVNFEWIMETGDGEVFTVYDYKEYRVLGKNEVVNWHIGGRSETITEKAKNEILAQLNK